jgi:hypothetical protein
MVADPGRCDGAVQLHEGTLARYMGGKFEAYIPSNAPIGFFWRPYTADRQAKDKAFGEKVRPLWRHA